MKKRSEPLTTEELVTGIELALSALEKQGWLFMGREIAEVEPQIIARIRASGAKKGPPLG